MARLSAMLDGLVVLSYLSVESANSSTGSSNLPDLASNDSPSESKQPHPMDDSVLLVRSGRLAISTSIELTIPQAHSLPSVLTPSQSPLSDRHLGLAWWPCCPGGRCFSSPPAWQHGLVGGPRKGALSDQGYSIKSKRGVRTRCIPAYPWVAARLGDGWARAQPDICFCRAAWIIVE